MMNFYKIVKDRLKVEQLQNLNTSKLFKLYKNKRPIILVKLGKKDFKKHYYKK